MALVQEAGRFGRLRQEIKRLKQEMGRMTQAAQRQPDSTQDDFEDRTLLLQTLRNDVNSLLERYGTRTKPQTLLGRIGRYVGAATLGLNGIFEGVTPLQFMDTQRLDQKLDDGTGKMVDVSIASFNAVPRNSDWVTFRIGDLPTYLQLRRTGWGSIFTGRGVFSSYVVRYASAEDARKYQEVINLVKARLEPAK